VDAVIHGPRGLSLGKDYDIVVISIDPDDTSDAAKQKHDHYLEMMNRKATDPGLTYLTGTEGNIKQVADAIGFGFKRNWTPDNKFAHQPGIFVCTPEGKLSHTITGLAYEPDELHFRLSEASNGKIGSGFLAIALCCGAMHFNPKTGHYENNPYFWIGTATGVVTILMVGGFLTMLWRADPKRKIEIPNNPNLPTPESM
jgi:protein SCO1/2